MRAFLAIVAAAALAIPAQVAIAADPLRLKPSSKWNVHYGDDSCRLARRFGDERARITLFLDQFGPDEGLRMTLLGKPLKRVSTGQPIDGAIRFGPLEQETEVTAMPAATDAEEPALLVNGGVYLAPPTEAEKAAIKRVSRTGEIFVRPPLGTAREAAVTWLHVRMDGGRDLVLETGPMDKPLAELQKCAWDTVATWGLDVEQQKSLSRPPSPLKWPWLRASDYPLDMIRDGHQAIIHARIMVDEAGNPTSCHIQASTRPKAFDDVVCQIHMKRARFRPALDAQARPVRSYWRQTVHFRIE